ncbi:starch-binding protein [Cohnella faecalis]|uniref:Cyclomaltodextrin glucanotransferase n=1 Tax=Cohnella faecalis TaxID=2315694 RepID=A0A398D0Q4_9BACL|nr:starch-binding protein [Cohnella faecalis]RIE04744.1 hypothetical protein D3H35_04480 [Cohnella faecalis]
MKKKTRSLWSIVLFLALVLQALNFTPAVQGSASAAASEEYGLPANTKDGLIFHAWNWSFDTIKANMPAIAAAGYKSVQTSPIQGNKENLMEGSKWWVLYQPTNFKIGNAQLGNRDQFKAMCDVAEQYGISVIVDVVANHTGNAGGGSLEYTPATNVDPVIRNNPSFWHEARGVSDWGKRWEVTHWGIGLPDLNTSNQDLQNIIIGFLNDAIALGADGFRFDAAKHIELPNEDGGSNFWPRVLGSLSKQNLYIYGEVLQGGADNFAGYAGYMNLTASAYGHDLIKAVGFGANKNVDLARSYSSAGVSSSKLVTWVESHDTYANDKSETTYMTDWQIKMGWALIASRAETTSLFLARPGGSGKFGTGLGQAGKETWKDADVAAVNKFHNAMVGQGEYLRTISSDLMLIERGTKGMTIVNLGGDASINSVTNLASGTYVNQATGGGTFTVANGRITGNIGGGKIAVLYQEVKPTPKVSIDAQEGGFYTDSLTVKMTYSDTVSASYSLNNGTQTALNSGDTVTFGAGAAFGTTYSLKIVANNAAGQTTKTYTFTKEDPNAALKVHFYKPSGWGTPGMYYYDDSVTPTKIGAAWPGTAMTDEGNGWYSTQVAGWKQAKVIFTSGSNQIPGASQPGYTVTGEKWIKDGVIHTSNPDVVIKTPTVSIDKAEGAFYTDSLDVTISYNDATAATYSLNGGAPVSFTSGQKATFGAGAAYGTTYTLNVTASNADKTTTKSYSFTKTKTALPAPTISIDKAEGTFYGNSLEVTVSYANADGATYTLNGGAQTNVASGQKITIGADGAFGTKYTLIVTASNEDKSTTKTFTFTKEDPNAGLSIHFYKPSGWGTPNIYYYNDSVTPTKIGVAWPGVAMTDEGNGWYVFRVTGWTQGKVIFNSGSNQIPGASQPGYAVTGEKWIKNGVIYQSNPDTVIPENKTPTITIDKSEGSFNSDSLNVAITLKDATSATYSLNGGAPVSFTSGQQVAIGAGDAFGTTYTLSVTAINIDKTATKTYTFKKEEEQAITVRYYKPDGWGTPNIYYYDESVTPTKIGVAWPGVAMQNEGNGWYSYKLTGWSKANVIFNSGGQQTPASGQAGYLVTKSVWIKNGVITDQEPVQKTVAVTFTIKNATTVSGQSIYLVGNVAELGNWAPASAIATTASTYPTWKVTVNLVEGTKIEFKAIKKNASNGVVWESGQNRSYTVSSSNPTVEFNFNN